MANLPSVPDYLAGYAPQQSDMQSLWTGPLTFFQRRVVFRASQTTTTTVLNYVSPVAIAYDTILEDPYSGWAASSSSWACPSGLSGWYQITVTAAMAAPGFRGLVVSAYAGASYTSPISGAPLAAAPVPGSGNGIASGSAYLYLAGGQDTCYGGAQVGGSGTPGGTTSTTAGQNSLIQISWIST